MLTPASAGPLALAQLACQARRGPLKVTYRGGSAGPEVAFAVPKSIGTAVVRNRIRRRLRAVLQEMARDDSGLLPGGRYLFRVSGPLEHLSHAELRSRVSSLLHRLRQVSPPKGALPSERSQMSPAK